MDNKLLTSLVFSSILLTLFTSTYAQNCSSHQFRNNNIFATCNPLPVLNSFLHWTYHSANHTVDLAYRHGGGVTDSDWVAWALNIGGSRMLGAQCLVAFRNSSGQIHAYTSPISPSSYQTQLREAPLSFRVPRIAAEFTNSEMVIFATLELPSGSSTSFNQVWQNGQVSGQSLQIHRQSGDNMRSFGTIDFASGQTSAGAGGDSASSRQRRRNTHGVLNAISWGVMMPMGAVFARYLKVFKSANPAWFYLHVACQASAYAVGVAGWGTGLKLGSDSVGIKFNTHRNIGITLFCLGTLQRPVQRNILEFGAPVYGLKYAETPTRGKFQHNILQIRAPVYELAAYYTGPVFALLLRPKPDHKYRLYWNIYHHTIGYTVIILSIINVFEGFDALNGQKYWKRAYIGVIIALGAIAVLLEAFTWFIVIKRKKTSVSDKYPNGNGANGVNAYANREV